jgi:hypothetical protein
MRKQKLGEDHPDTLTSMTNLAFLWKEQGRDMEAIQLMEDCAQRLKCILGDSHPDFSSSDKILAEWKVGLENSGSSV